jgi:hypothetical protein
MFTQSELNDVIRYLGLPKGKAEILDSRLKENNLLAAETSMYSYIYRKQAFTCYFSQDGDLVYYCNIAGLMQKFGVDYKGNDILKLQICIQLPHFIFYLNTDSH